MNHYYEVLGPWGVGSLDQLQWDERTCWSLTLSEKTESVMNPVMSQNTR